MTSRLLLYTLPAVALFASCTSKQYVATASSPSTEAPKVKKMDPMIVKSKIPKATAFRMSGDYENNVAITLNSEGGLLYYPAPTDISASSAPLKLDNGWWLNRQGVSGNSVFTSYTFSEYSQLPSVPSTAQLLEAVIPGAKVTQIVQLPYTINEAQYHISDINSYLKDIDYEK